MAAGGGHDLLHAAACAARRNERCRGPYYQFSRQGRRIHLNGSLVAEKMAKHLRRGNNVIAATSFMQYCGGKDREHLAVR